MRAATDPIQLYIVKIAGACNLDCSYCYVYHKGDDAHLERSAIMSETTYEACLARIADHARASKQQALRITFHGGEPCLVGVRRFERWCVRARELLVGLDVHLTLQTNGTLLDEKWVRSLIRQRVQVGVSLDGPAAINDRMRIDHRGRGSHARVMAGLQVLRMSGHPFGILCVIPLGASGLEVHRHLRSLGSNNLHYLLPDYTHDSISVVRDIYGSTPVADFLLPIFDDWWRHGDVRMRIKIFENLARMILGGRCDSDSFGNGPLGFVVVEVDGAIEGLDCLRICENRITSTGLNVHTDAFERLQEVGDVNAQFLFRGSDLPSGCATCPEAARCGGGYLPHRYSHANGFNNPSVWCADLRKLFLHLRLHFDVDVAETAQRWQVLDEMSRGLVTVAA